MGTKINTQKMRGLHYMERSPLYGIGDTRESQNLQQQVTMWKPRADVGILIWRPAGLPQRKS